jgi:Zn-dependent peptidase ImmA (M78 family)
MISNEKLKIYKHDIRSSKGKKRVRTIQSIQNYSKRDIDTVAHELGHFALDDHIIFYDVPSND